MEYTANVQVKSYVKQYLVNNCGNPCDLHLLPSLRSDFKQLLQRAPHWRDKQIKGYPDDLEILITEDEFYRYGWELTPTATIRFNELCENRVKMMSRAFIDMRKALGVPINLSVIEFQDRFNYPEDVFKSDSIIKDWRRNKSEVSFDAVHHIKSFLDNLFMDYLSKIGTVSDYYIKNQYHDQREAITELR